MRPKRNFTANLHVDDIQGARPKVFAPKEVNKPEFYNNNSDIQGSKPRTLHVGLNNPFGSLKSNDIEGSKPDLIKFKTKRVP